MQSSGMVAFRATIMIVCMVALPLAAVLGTALPKVMQSAIQGQTNPAPSAGGGATNGSQSAKSEPVDETGDSNVVGAESAQGLPRARITAVRSVAGEEGERPSTAALWSRDDPTARPATSRQGAEGNDRRTPRSPRATGPTEPTRRGESPLRATTYSTSLESEVVAASHTERAGALNYDEPLADDPLSRGERRLRELGAISYRLETWGVTGELYRFSCKVALSDHGQATCHFEATETSPAKVIETVLEQVEAWHDRRPRAPGT